VRRGCDGQARGRALPLGSLRRLDGPSECTHVGASGLLLFDGCTLAAAVLLAGFNDLPLPFSYVQAALELRAHGRVLGVEAGRQAGETHVHDIGAAGARGSGCEGAGGVDDVVVGQVQASRAMTCGGGGGGHVWRGRLLLDDYSGGWGAAGPARGRAVRAVGVCMGVEAGRRQ